MTNKRWIEIIGILLTLAGVLAGFVVYGMQVCDETDQNMTKLDNEIRSEERLESEYKYDLDKLIEKKESISQRNEGLKKYWNKNREYINDLEMYLEVDRYKAMARNAIRKMGGRDVSLFERDIPKWKKALREEGFVLGAPIREIMSLISTSGLTTSMPVDMILSQPSNAGEFIDSLTEWQNKIDEKYSKFFERLLYAFGLEHPKAGKDLDLYLTRRLSEEKDRILGVEKDIEIIKEKIFHVQNNIDKYRAQIESTNAPVYCKIL
jgi:cell division protein FtsL